MLTYRRFSLRFIKTRTSPSREIVAHFSYSARKRAEGGVVDSLVILFWESHSLFLWAADITAFHCIHFKMDTFEMCPFQMDTSSLHSLVQRILFILVCISTWWDKVSKKDT
jgi:hypothetical protein